MKVQYVADDGKIFDTESKCLMYERHRNLGGDNRFLIVVDDVLGPLAKYDERDNKVIYFSSTADMTEVAVAIVRNIDRIIEVYDEIAQEQLKAKVVKPTFNATKKAAVKVSVKNSK